MFFCKDCDGYRVQGQSVGIYGWTDEAVHYALAMLMYSPTVLVFTDGRRPRWGKKQTQWLQEYKIPVREPKVRDLVQRNGRIARLILSDGTEFRLQALFITRGDIYKNELARGLGAKLDSDGEIVVDADMRASVPGLYAAGCVTPANCQMIIAAGQGATAAQAINRDLLKESLRRHKLGGVRRQHRRNRTPKTARSLATKVES